MKKPAKIITYPQGFNLYFFWSAMVYDTGPLAQPEKFLQSAVLIRHLSIINNIHAMFIIVLALGSLSL